MTVTAHALGSGQDGGWPQLGNRPLPGHPARSAASLAVVASGGQALLIDASPDLRHQQQRLWDVPEYGARTGPAPFDGIVLTHGHMGHYTGLVHFGREALDADLVPCWVTPSMAAFLSSNAPWSALVGDNIDLREIEPGESFEPWPGLSLRLVAVPHRAEYTDTVGVSIADELFYLPDIDGWNEWPGAAGELERHATSIVDGSFYSADELPGRDLDEIKHPLVTDTVRRFGYLAGSHRIVLTHLNHSNPVGRPMSAEHQAVTAAGFEVAEDMSTYEVIS